MVINSLFLFKQKYAIIIFLILIEKLKSKIFMR